MPTSASGPTDSRDDRPARPLATIAARDADRDGEPADAKSDADDLREEHDFAPEGLRRGVRGKHAERHAQSTDLVPMDPDVAEVFSDAAAVNRALRARAGIIEERSRSAA